MHAKHDPDTTQDTDLEGEAEALLGEIGVPDTKTGLGDPAGQPPFGTDLPAVDGNPYDVPLN